MKSIIWVLTSTTSKKEAEKIGKAMLGERLAACFSVVPKMSNVYFWPPKTGKLEVSRGPLLILETLPKNVKKIQARVKQIHSDKVPFTGTLEIKNVSEEFYEWMTTELR